MPSLGHKMGVRERVAYPHGGLKKNTQALESIGLNRLSKPSSPKGLEVGNPKREPTPRKLTSRQGMNGTVHDGSMGTSRALSQRKYRAWSRSNMPDKAAVQPSGPVQSRSQTLRSEDIQ